MLLTEYDEQAHIKSEREIALKEGEEIGFRNGEVIGFRNGELRMSQLIQLLIAAGRSTDIELVASDEQARKQFYAEFGLE